MDSVFSIIIIIGVIIIGLLLLTIFRYATKKTARMIIDKSDPNSTKRNNEIDSFLKDPIPRSAAQSAKYYLDFLDNREEIITDNSHSIDAYGQRIYLPLAKEETLFGRDKSICDLVINNLTVSRIQFIIRITDESPLIINKSTNGTTLNGKLIHQAKLKSGDIITVGKTSFLFNKYMD